MRRKEAATPFVILAFSLFLWASVPKPIADEIRSFAAASLAPSWKFSRLAKNYLSDRPLGERKEVDSEQILRLQLENQILRTQIERISEWMSSDRRVREQLDVLKGFEKEESRQKEERRRAFFERRSAHLRDLLKWELMAMPAHVIYRDPASWSSSLWINVGEEDNRTLGRTVIAKNSPVVAGTALVGVVDYVGRKQSRVRLITDSGLSPSVRAVRGAAQNREIASLATGLMERLVGEEELVQKLARLKAKLGAACDEAYLAKGEIHGSSAPFWRARNQSLQGIGFNFDYADEDGASTGEKPILLEGDLLITTGLDGVFPPDLLVGRVVKKSDGKLGGCAFEIEARPAAASLNDLGALFVLPPQGD